MKINILLRLLYRFLQFFVWFTYRIYFKRLIFLNRHWLKTRAPLLVLTNHPNTLMDPLVVLHALRERCFILANYSLFKNPVSRAIFSTLYCLPLQRAKDVEGSVKNDDTFKQCDLHLAAKGSIYIAPEGISAPERHVRPFKTGTARIAFSAEKHGDFDLGLQILLVGLTYENPLKFRQRLVANVGEPIAVKDWETLYRQNPRAAVQDLTQHLEEKMKELVVHCSSAEEDAFLKKIDTLAHNEKPLNTEGAFWRSKRTVTLLNLFETTNPDAFAEVKTKIEDYFFTLNELKIRDLNPQKSIILSAIVFILLLPVLILGAITSGLPAWLSDGVARLLKLDESYETTARYASGLILFPLFWGLTIKLVYAFLPVLATYLDWKILFALLLPLGLAAWHVGTEGGRLLNYFRYNMHDAVHQLIQKRRDIISELHRIG